jgi:2-polyprenyl-3-methyl-5-hydroxy-6-metoxy-1,4-benzoquinol methylase
MNKHHPDTINNESINTINSRARDRYDSRIKEHGFTIESLGWGEEKQQEYRFSQVLKNIDLKGLTIIDFGCGYGDLYNYLNSKKIDFASYTGIDINNNFIEEAQNRYQGVSFIHIESENDLPDLQADVVIMLGLLNYNHQDINKLDYAKHLISKASSISSSIICCDFISSIRDDSYEREEWIYYYQPADVFDIALNFSTNFKIDHSYDPIPQKELLLTITL